MKNSPSQPSKGSTYLSGQTAQEVQDGRVRIRESRNGSRPAATDTMATHTKPHTDRPADLTGAASYRGQRRTVTVAVLGVLSVLATLVLVTIGYSTTEVAPATGTYAGDWKDTLAEENGSQPYTGDWKDALTERNGSQPYTGDWKDLLTERGR